jgi:hypothetical protein
MPDTRNANNLFAAADCLGYMAPVGTVPPVSPITGAPGTASMTGPLQAPWICMGWIDTTGLNFKLTETLKDIMASGTLEPIRTIIASAVKTFDANFLEALNPAVRALYDDVNINALDPAGGPLGAVPRLATYVLPDVPSDNRYAFIFDALDGDKEIRQYAPNGKVTARTQDVQTQADAEMLQMTLTLYPALIGSVRSCMMKLINYGALPDLTPFYTQ